LANLVPAFRPAVIAFPFTGVFARIAVADAVYPHFVLADSLDFGLAHFLTPKESMPSMVSREPKTEVTPLRGK
jgi:hypothetical protein